MNPLVCKCGEIDNYHKELSGPHIKAVCNVCGSYIQFLPQGFTHETVMFYGKHKGKMLKNIPPDYLVWLYQNTKVNGSLKLYIEANMNLLKSKIYESK